MTFKATNLSRPEYIRTHIAINANGCWIWGGSSKSRYRMAKYRGEVTPAHRFSYAALIGPIPDGLVIDHLCKNTACVNPAHLEAVTQKENIHRGDSPAAINRKKTLCINGHQFTPDNTYIWRNGGRGCRICIKKQAYDWIRSEKGRKHMEKQRTIHENK